MVVAPQGQSGNTSEEAQWSAFKPQANLSPILLDTGADHLEVMKFSEAIETYIVTGFRGQVPKSGVWKYIAPKQDLPVSGGAIKKAGVGDPPKLTKVAKKRQMKLKKKAEEERKEAEAAINMILKKLVHHTESCDQMLRHVPAGSKVFAVIDAASGYQQLRVSEESQELLTIVIYMGRFKFKCLPQGISSAANL